MRFRMTAKTVARQRGMAVARESAEKANARNHHNAASTIFSNNSDNTLSDTNTTADNQYNYNYTGITPITALNIKKVTQFRRDGLAEFDRLVRNFEQHQHFEHALTGNANDHYRYHRAITPINNNNEDADDVDDDDDDTKLKPGSSSVPSHFTVLTRLNSRAIERRLEREALAKKRVYPVQVRGRMSKKGESRADRAERKKDAERRRRIQKREDELDDGYLTSASASGSGSGSEIGSGSGS